MKIIKLPYLTMLVLVSVAMTGCATEKKITYSYVTTNSVPVKTTDEGAQAQLAESAASVTGSLQELSAMQMAIQPKAKIPRAASVVAPGLMTRTSLDWTGPVASVLHRVAGAAGYRLRVIGTEPAIPVLVFIQKRDVTLGDIIRDTSLQVVKKAEVSVYPQSRTIELRYLTPGTI